jgi:hypothetical protein
VTQWVQNKNPGSGAEMAQRKNSKNGTVPVPECFGELNIFLVGWKFLLDLGSFSRSKNIFEEENLFLWFICES